MKFIEALAAMKAGKKVKLPAWRGYWSWDEDKKTVLIHTHEGKTLDIRETERVEYTINNLLSEDWLIAEEENTPILGGVATMGFGDAIKYLKRGLKVARIGWNGKGMFLFLVNVTEFETDADMTNFMQSEEKFSMPNVVAMKTADNNIVVGWLASQTDMLAEDWMIVD